MHYIFPVTYNNGALDLDMVRVIGYQDIEAANRLMRQMNAAVKPPLAVGAVRFDAPDKKMADEQAAHFIGSASALFLLDNGGAS